MLPPAFTRNKVMFIQKYHGVKIRRDEEDGYHASFGNADFGYCETVDEIQAEIDDYFKGPNDPRARQAIGWD